MATNFEPYECVILVQSTTIGTHKIKAIHLQQSSIRFFLETLTEFDKDRPIKYSDDLIFYGFLVLEVKYPSDMTHTCLRYKVLNQV